MNLTDETNGAVIVFSTDDFFGEAENMLKKEDPVFIEDKYTEYGKWMDGMQCINKGWETRRKRSEGHDWCIVRLAAPAKIEKVVVDTCFFTGNYAPKFSIQAVSMKEFQEARIPPGIGSCSVVPDALKKSNEWLTIVSKQPLASGYQETRFTQVNVNNDNIVTHIRVNIYPDGGIARLKVFGTIIHSHSDSLIELSSVINGSKALEWSEAHFGLPLNLLLVNRAKNMGQGWETARNPNRPEVYIKDENGNIGMIGSDYVVIQLGFPGFIQKVQIDTLHFKGNYPESFILHGKAGHGDWFIIKDRTKLNGNELKEWSVNGCFAEQIIWKNKTFMTTCCTITDSSLSLTKVIQKVKDDRAGAISTFQGTTRNHFHGKPVLKLEYESYVPMAEKELFKICNESRLQFDCMHIAVEHRIGLVPIGECSVVIAVSSHHRKAAMKACAFIIDNLKQRVPIWKREYYADGSQWKSNACC